MREPPFSLSFQKKQPKVADVLKKSLPLLCNGSPKSAARCRPRGSNGNQVRILNSSRCCKFLLRRGGANVCDTLLPLTFGLGRRRRRNESEDLPLRLNFVLPFLASAIRASSIAPGLTKWVGILRLRVTGEGQKHLLGRKTIEREALRRMHGTGLQDFRLYDTPVANFAAGFFCIGVLPHRAETYLPTRLSGERRRD